MRFLGAQACGSSWHVAEIALIEHQAKAAASLQVARMFGRRIGSDPGGSACRAAGLGAANRSMHQQHSAPAAEPPNPRRRRIAKSEFVQAVLSPLPNSNSNGQHAQAHPQAAAVAPHHRQKRRFMLPIWLSEDRAPSRSRCSAATPNAPSRLPNATSREIA